MFLFSLLLLPAPAFLCSGLKSQYKLVEIPEGFGEDEEFEYEFGVRDQSGSQEDDTEGEQLNNS